MSSLTLEQQAYPGAATPEKNIMPPDDARQKTLRILIAGAGGTIGSAVAPYLAHQGHTIVRLVRRAPNADEVRWDPDAVTIDAAGLEGFDGKDGIHETNTRLAPGFD